MTTKATPKFELIQPALEHVAELGRICFEAFKEFHDRHAFPRDLPEQEVATHVIGMLVSRKDCYGTAARVDGRLAGSNFLLMSDPVGAVGPITEDPALAGRGLGRALMQGVLDHARSIGMDQVRLMQDSFNTKSFSLYASLGFDAKEPVAMMDAKPAAAPDPSVRPATTADLDCIDELSRRIYRCSRRGEVAGAMAAGFSTFVREKSGRMTGYFMPGFLGHGVAETDTDALALIGEAARQAPPPFALFFCPLTSTDFFRASLKAGHRLRKIMTLMTKGPYERPQGIWMPSIGY